MACKWRYFDELVPFERDHSLSFGSIIHECLRLWHEKRDAQKVQDYIDRTYASRSQDECLKADWHLASAIMTSYAQRYTEESFAVMDLEKKFQGPIINPNTGAASRSFLLAGKVDGIVIMDGRYYLMEHKTTSQFTGSYLERLWCDFQIILYSWYVERLFKIAISGVIYNIIQKTRLTQSKGENEAEYQARCAELIAKSKTGKTSAKRRMPESDEEFRARLMEKYSEPDMFHREILYLSRDQLGELTVELWELSKSLLDARRRNTFYRNTSYCLQYGRLCAYFPLCQSNGNPNVIQNLYKKAAPHEELNDAEMIEPASAF